MTPDLEFKLEYAVEFSGGKLTYAPVEHREGDAPSIGTDCNLAVTVTRWTDKQIECNKRIRYESTTGPADVAQFYAEVLRQTTHPRKCTVRSAYVYLVKEGAERKDSGDDYVAFDRSIAADKPIIPALYCTGVNPVEQFTHITDAYNGALLKQREAESQPQMTEQEREKIVIVVPPWAEVAAFTVTLQPHAMHQAGRGGIWPVVR